MKQSVEGQSKKMYDMMYNEQFKTDLDKVLRARVPIVQLKTNDERRLRCFFEHFCRIKGYDLYTWNCVDGLVNETRGDHYAGTIYRDKIADARNLHDVLKFVLEKSQAYSKSDFYRRGKKGDIFLLSELEYYLNDPIVVRYLKNIYGTYAASTLFFPSTKTLESSSIDCMVTKIVVPNPSDAEYENVYESMLDMLRNSKHDDVLKRVIADKDVLLEKVQGMTLEESQIALAIQCITYHNELKGKEEDDSEDAWSALSQMKKHLFKDNS